MLTVNSLPNTFGIGIQTIQKKAIFPIFSYTLTEPWIWIMEDGSLFQLFEIVNDDEEEINKIIRMLPFGSSLQLYSLYKENECKKYLAVKVNCPQPDLDRNIFLLLIKPGSSKGLNNAIVDKTAEVAEQINKMCYGLESVNYANCDLLHYLTEYAFDKITRRIYSNEDIKTNLSVIKSGKDKYGTVSSVQNCSKLHKMKTINNVDYLKVTTIICPDMERNRKLVEKESNDGRLLESINDGKRINQYNIDEKKMCYFNISYCFIGSSIELLLRKQNEFENEALKNGMKLYTHSHSSIQQYLSLVPGRADVGEHFTIISNKDLLHIWKGAGND